MEAASLAWNPLGARCAFVAEIDPAACTLLAERHPDVPNLGDLTKWRDWPEALLVSIDVLIGGTPCQGFSFAGLRKSLSDDRSNLALEFLELADAIDALRRAAGRPALVIVWENVPGVYSAADNAFGCFLGAIVGADAPLVPGRGQKWTHAGVADGPARKAAWRTLDAQFFGLAQRRARVFVVASAGACCPAAVLLERCSVPGNPAPRREAGQGTAGAVEAGAEHGLAKALKATDGGVDREDGHTLIPVAFKASHYTRDKDGAPSVTAPPLSADADKGDQDTLICSPEIASTLAGGARREGGYSLDDIQLIAFGGNNTSGPIDVATALRAKGGTGHGDFETETFIAFDTTSVTQPNNRSNPQPGDPVHTLAANQHPPAIAFNCKSYAQDAQDDLAPTLRSMNEIDGRPNGGGAVAVAYAIQAGAIKNTASVNASRDTTGPDGLGIREDLAYTLEARPEVQAVAFAMRGRDGENMPEQHEDGETASALRAESGGSTRDLVAFADVADPLVVKEGETYTQEGSGNFRVRNVVTDLVRWAVRRLTPTECERLQGAPDGHTLVKARRVPRKNNALIAQIADAGGAVIVLGKPGHERPYQWIDGEAWTLMADGPRYKLLGNSKAVPVVRWIGERIIMARAA